MKLSTLILIALAATACSHQTSEVGGDPQKKVACYEKYGNEIWLRETKIHLDLYEALVSGKPRALPASYEADVAKNNSLRGEFAKCLKAAGVSLE